MWNKVVVYAWYNRNPVLVVNYKINKTLFRTINDSSNYNKINMNFYNVEVQLM